MSLEYDNEEHFYKIQKKKSSVFCMNVNLSHASHPLRKFSHKGQHTMQNYITATLILKQKDLHFQLYKLHFVD